MAGSVLRESGEALGAGFDSAPSLGLFFQHVSFQREKFMSGQVVLYFEGQADALRFALAAGSVMGGEGAKFTSDLVEKTTGGQRIRLAAVKSGGSHRGPTITVCGVYSFGRVRA